MRGLPDSADGLSASGRTLAAFPHRQPTLPSKAPLLILALLALVVGIAVLAVAADQFVIGAARVALIKNVPSIVVGVVIIGFGTSAPEILVSALAAFDDQPDVAVGNIVGSNIANLSLLLGIGALIVPLAVDSRTVRREALMVVGAVALFGVFVQGGGVNRIEGVILLVAMAAALFVITRTQAGDPLGPETEEFADASHHSFPREVVRTVIGLVLTVGSGRLLLWGALDLADRAGLSAGFVGATLVSIGTSLPELVTVIQSARRSETDLIVGNLLGSNLFNALAAGGVVGLIGAPQFDDTSLTTIAATAAVLVAVVAAISMRTNLRVSRVEGGLLALAYVVIVPLLA